MKVTQLFFFLLFINFSCLFAQDLPKISGFPSKSTARQSNARWMFAPSIVPFIPLYNWQTDEFGNNVEVNYDRGILLGFRFEKYAPNNPRGWGLLFEYLNRDIYLETNGRYLISENAFSINPYFIMKSKNFEKLSHPYLMAGLRNQVTFSNQIVTPDGLLFENSEIIRKFKMWGSLGFGLVNDLFNKGKNGIPLSQISLVANFSLLNQYGLFKRDPRDFPPSLQVFRNSQSSNFFVTFTYTQMLDVRKNTNETSYRMSPGLEPKDASQFFPSLYNLNVAKKFISGNFYFHVTGQGEVDSSFISISQLTPEIQDLRQAFELRAGYSIHFWGNHKKFIGKKGNELYFSKDNGIRWNLFLSGGINDRRVALGKGTRNRIHRLMGELSAGFRIGIPPLYFLGGYTRQFTLNETYYTNNESFTDFNFSNISSNVIFAGLSLRNGLLVKVNYIQIETLKEEKKLLDNFSISIGMGL